MYTENKTTPAYRFRRRSSPQDFILQQKPDGSRAAV